MSEDNGVAIGGWSEAVSSTDSNTQTQAVPHQSGGWSPSVQTHLAKAEVESGRLSREQANEMLRSSGIAELPAAQKATHELDIHFPKAESTQFQIPSNGVLDLNKSEGAGLHNDLRNWLSTAEFTKEIGSHVASEIGSFDHEGYQRMGDAEKTLFEASEDDKFFKVFGNDSERKLALAGELIREIEVKRPGFINFLERSGSIDRASVIAQFAMQADRLDYKKSSQK
ncbi:MAG: hypothetical protein SGJ18_15120 [Pseudomonadota bacterium]|nr:hypothetical protein [Pseudomonadota bacterium]